MCKLRKLNGDTFVADIKYDYIINIIAQAKKCEGIDKVVLFGSSLNESCKKKSDIDIAVFGKNSKSKYLRSKEFKNFHRNVFLYNCDSGQNYDILYFVSSNEYKDDIIKEIKNGSTIYKKA